MDCFLIANVKHKLVVQLPKLRMNRKDYKMKIKWFLLINLIYSVSLLAQEIEVKKTVYLIPGQGSDGRLFQQIHIENYDTVHIRYLLPEKEESLTQYASRLAAQIDTTAPYSIVGVSLGGMIATELSDLLSPEEVIIISSAKSKYELPTRYKIFKIVPLYKIIGGKTIIKSAKLAQPIFEPTDKITQAHFHAMISDKEPYFMKRAVAWIITWNRTTYDADIIHIHGDRDHTLPLKHVDPNQIVKGGSHIMTMTKSEEISKLLNFYLQ